MGLIPSHGPGNGHMSGHRCPSQREETRLTPLILFIGPLPSAASRDVLHHVSLPSLGAPGGQAGSRPRGVAYADCSPAPLETGPVASAAQINHCLLQPDILTVPFCPTALIRSPGEPANRQYLIPICGFHLYLCAYIFMRLTDSHGPAQNHLLNNGYTLELWNGR
jgi:hypothetical protein